jgi:hypothetical protein
LGERQGKREQPGADHPRDEIQFQPLKTEEREAGGHGDERGAPEPGGLHVLGWTEGEGNRSEHGADDDGCYQQSSDVEIQKDLRVSSRTSTTCSRF